MTAGRAVAQVEPLGVILALEAGETIMTAARRAGLRWPTICQGAALCGACYCRVVETSEALPAVSAKEQRGLKMVPPHLQGPQTRLACQLVPKGRITVERTGVVKPG